MADVTDISDMPAAADLFPDATPDISDMPAAADLFPDAKPTSAIGEGLADAGKALGTARDTLKSGIVGAGEEFLKAGTSQLAAVPAGLAYAGAAIAKAAGKDISPAQVQADVQQYLTYQPRSDAAKAASAQFAETYGPAWQTIAKYADKLATKVGKVSPAAETALREAPAAAQAAGGLLGAGSIVKGATSLKGASPAIGAPKPSIAPAPEPAPPSAEPLAGAVTPEELQARPSPLTLEDQPARSAPSDVGQNEPATGATPTGASGATSAAPETSSSPPPSASSVSRFNAPSETRFTPPSAEGARAGKVSAPEQAYRTRTLQDLNALTGGQLEEVRKSAISGDTGETGQDWAHAKPQDLGGKRMQEVIAGETNAVRTAMDNVVQGVGAQEKGVDRIALRQRGAALTAPVDSVDAWYERSIQKIYEDTKARAEQFAVTGPDGKQLSASTPMAGFKALMDTKSHFYGSAEGKQFYEGLQTRAKELGILGDNGVFKPATLNQVEQLRQYASAHYNSKIAKLNYAVKDALDDDATILGGEDLFKAARKLRRQKHLLMDAPDGIGQLHASSDGITANRDTPLENVPDFIANLPDAQFEHMVHFYTAASKLGDPDIARQASAALTELKGHMLSRVADAGGSKVQGGWSPKSAYEQLNKYSTKLPLILRPDELKALKTINDAGNVLRMDKYYKGAKVEEFNTGIGNGLRARMGDIARGAVDTAVGAHTFGVGGAVMEATGLSKRIGKAIGGDQEAIAARKRLEAVNGRIQSLTPAKKDK